MIKLKNKTLQLVVVPNSKAIAFRLLLSTELAFCCSEEAKIVAGNCFLKALLRLKLAKCNFPRASLPPRGGRQWEHFRFSDVAAAVAAWLQIYV